MKSYRIGMKLVFEIINVFKTLIIIEYLLYNGLISLL